MNDCLFEKTRNLLLVATCSGPCDGKVHGCPAYRAQTEEQIRRTYPLFEFEFCRHLDPDKHGHHCCIIDTGHRAFFDEKDFWNYHHIRSRFAAEHRSKATTMRLHALYPHLELRVAHGHSSMHVAGVWVRHKGPKNAAMPWPEPGLPLDDPSLHERLAAHGRAEEGKAYGAGFTFRYCQEAADKNGWRKGQAPTRD